VAGEAGAGFYRDLLEGAGVALLVADVGGRVVYATPPVEALVGKRTLVGARLERLLRLDPAMQSWLRELARGREVEPLRRQQVVQPAGELLAVEVELREATGSAGGGVVVTLHPRPHPWEIEGVDELTGLPLRRRFLDLLTQQVVALRREAGVVSVAVLGLDDFGAVTERFGVAVGDLVLREVARRLQRAIREGDSAARFVSDEFLVLLPDADEDEAMAVLGRVVAAIGAPLPFEGEVIATTASAGVATTGEPADPETLLRAADSAMYYARSQGRGRVEVARPGQREAVRRRLRTDDRTGLLNARAFEEDARAVHAAAVADDRPYGVLLADVDCFHEYNERYLHLAGHEALRRSGQAMAAAARAADGVTYRYGGEEFATLLPAVAGLSEARDVAEALRASVEALTIPHEAQRHSRVLTVSVGVASGPRTTTGHPGVVLAADQALLRAKQAGRNRVATTANS
jgi:diguanylate cyclase (GGDEF)-like protein